MGLFDFFKKKEQPEDTKSNQILMAMPMFNFNETFEKDKVIECLKTKWNTDVSKIHGEKDTVTFTVQGEIVALSTIPLQIPWGDIKGTAQYAYNWDTAEKDLENHNSHIIVSIMTSNNNTVERFGILTKVLSSILETSNCIGIYHGSQSLLIPKQQYLDNAEALKSNLVPIHNWIYIGMGNGENGNNAYTFGLHSFDKQEMEFINCDLELEDMYTFLSNICAYILTNNITFRSGETLGYTAEQKIKITKSKGHFVEGQTLKLEM